MDKPTLLTDYIDEERQNLVVQGRRLAELSADPALRKAKPIHELIFYLVQQKYDLAVLQDRLIHDETNRSVWLKYLALQMYEVMEKCPTVAKQVVSHYQTIGAGGRAEAQVRELDWATREFGRQLRPIKSRTGQMLGAVRNTVAAHHGSSRGTTLGMTPLIDWTYEHASTAGQPMAEEHQQLMHAVWDLAQVLTNFGEAIRRALL